MTECEEIARAMLPAFLSVPSRPRTRSGVSEFVRCAMLDESYTIRSNVADALFNLIPQSERGTD